VNIFLGSPAIALRDLDHRPPDLRGPHRLRHAAAEDRVHRPCRARWIKEWLDKSAIMGSLSLYLNFINIFMFLLQFMGNRE
jgi:hypothetical protein